MNFVSSVFKKYINKNQDKQKECEETDKNIAQISVLRESDTNSNSLCQNPNGTSSIDEEECFQDAETNPAKQIDSASNDVTNNERRSIEPSEFEGYQIKQSKIDVSSDLGLLSSKSYIRNEPSVKNQTLKIIPQTSNVTEPDSLKTSMIDSLELNKEGLIHKLTDSIEVLKYDGKESLFSDHEAQVYESLGYITTDSTQNISNFGKIGNTRFTSDNGIKTTVDFDKNYEKGKTDRRVFSNENVPVQNKPVSLSDILFDSPSRSSVQPTISEPTILNKKADCQSSSEVRINNTTDNVIPLTENSSTQSKTALEELIRNVNQTFAIGHNSVTKSKQEKEKLVSKEKIISSIEQNVESIKKESSKKSRQMLKKLKSEEILKDASNKEVNVNANQELKSDTNHVKESSESNSEFKNEEILIDKEVIGLKIKATENQIYDNHIVKNVGIDRTDFFKKSEKDNTSDKQFIESKKKPKETCESKGLQKVMPPTLNKQTQQEIAINKIEDSIGRKSLKSLEKLIDSEQNSDIKIKDREKHLEINHKLKCEKLLANNMNGKESSSFSKIKLDEKENLTSTAKEINQNPSVVELRESTKQSTDQNSQPEQSVEYNVVKGQNTQYNDSKQNTKETYEDLSKNVSSSSLIKADEENKSNVLQVKSKENNESGPRVEQNHMNVVNGQNSRNNDSKPTLEETQGDASISVSRKESVKSQYQVFKTIENNYSKQRNVMPSTSTEQKQHEMAINTIEDSVERKYLKILEKLIEIEPNTDYIENPEKPLQMNHKSNSELLANNMIGKDSSDISRIELNEKEYFTPTAKEINQNQSVVIELRENTKQSLDCRNNQPEPPVEYQENNVAKGQNTLHNDSKQNTEETYEDVSGNSLTNVDKENESKVKSKENKESGLRVEQNHNNVVYRQNSQYNDSKPMLGETQGDASKRVSIKENVKYESQVLQEKTLENNYSEQRKDQQINNVVHNVKTHENLSTEIPNCLQTKIDEKNKQATPREEQELQQLSKETHEHLNKEIISGLQTIVNKTEVLENKSTENNQTERPVKQQNDVGKEQNKLTEKNHEYLSKEIPSDLQTKVEKPEVLEVKSTENSEQKCEKTFRGEITETSENLEKQFKGEKTDKPKCQQNQEELVRNHKINKEISFNSEEIDKVQKVLTTVDTSSTRIKECLINKTDINQNTCSKEEQEQITEKCENAQEQVENKCTSKRAENHEPSRNNNIITEKQSSKTYIDEKDPAEVAKILKLKTSVIENELNDLVSNVTENKINNTVQQLENTSEEYLQLDSKLRTEDVLKGNTVVDTNNESSIKTKETDQTKVSETVNLKSLVKEGQVMENINQGRKAEAAVNKFDTKDCIDLLKESDASMFPETKEPFQNNLAEVVTLEADQKEFIIYQTKILDTNLLEKHQQESAIDERQDTKGFENQCKEKQSKENLESEIKGGSATFEPLVINNGKTMVEKAREQECNISYVRQDTKEFENLERQYTEFDQNINQLKTEDILGELVSKCSKKGLEADNTRIYYRQDTREFEMLEKEFAESTSAINSPIIKGVGEETVFYRQDTEEFENLERQFKANAQNNTLIDDILGELVSQSTSTSGVEPIFSITSSNQAEEKINMEQAKENVKSVPGNDITIQNDNKNSQCVKISNKLNDQNKNNGKEIEFCRQDPEEFENLKKQCNTTIQKNTLGNDILGKLVSQNASTTDVESNLYTTNVNQAEGKINREKTKDNVIVASGNSIITQINTKNNQRVEIPNKLDDQDQSTNHIESEEILDVSIKEGVIKHHLESNSDKTGNEIPFDDQQLSISETAKINLQGEKEQEWIDKSLINDDKQEDYKNKPLNAPGGSINKKKPINRVEIHPNIRNKQINTKLISSNDDEVEETNQQFSNTNEELKTKVKLLQQELDSIKKRNKRKDQSVVTSTTEKEVDKGVIFKYRKLIEDYEKRIAKQTEDLKKLKNESEINVRHFTNTEMAFSDVFEKYEKAKFVITVYRKNEDTLLENIQNAEEQLSKIEAKCQSMKQQSLDQIRRGNEQIVKEKAHYKQDVTKLQAQVKRLEIKAASLELALKQKTDECQALAALCDDITGRNST